MEQRREDPALALAPVRGLHEGATVEVPALVALARHPWRKGDVARALGVSERQVSRYMQRGLPFCKPFGPGGMVCFAPLQVERWRARLTTSRRVR